MNSRIVILFVLFSIVCATDNGPNSAPVDMNKKIKQIAKGIVDKWVDEGLTVTRDKVEKWINIVDQSQVKAKAEKQKNQPEKAAEVKIQQTAPKPPPADSLGSDFNQVKDTLVKTFTKIGKVPCKDCKKPVEVKKAPSENERLEAMSLEELKEKQELIKSFGQMSKMAKLAKLASNFQNLGKLKDRDNVAQKLDSTSTKHEEL